MTASFKKLYALFNAHDKILFLLLFMLMGIASVVEVIGIGAIPVFVALITDPDALHTYPVLPGIIGYFGITSAEEILVWGAVALIGLFVVKNVYLSFFIYVQAKIIYGRQSILGDRLFAAYMDAPYSSTLHRNAAEMQRNINVELRYLFSEVVLCLLTMILEAVTVAAVFLLLFFIEPFITLGAIGLMGVAGVSFLTVVKKKFEDYGKQALATRGEMIKTVSQGIGAIKEIRVLRRESFFKRKFSENLRRYMHSLKYHNITLRLPKPFMESVIIVAMLLITLTLFLQGRAIESIIPLLTLFAMASVRIMPAIKEIVAGYTQLRYYLPVVDPIYEDLTRGENLRDAKPPDMSLQGEPLKFEEKIELHGIHYRYPDTEQEILSGVSLTIPKGSAVAFVGPTGVGKTTLVDIILGLLEPSAGAVMVDGVDIRQNVEGWQRKLGYIPQFIYLADDTVRRNIAFGIPDAGIDGKKIETAVRAAHLDDVIKNLKDGLDTYVGENGIRLSGGQRQRVGIARALYHEPDILVMDEATSALDNNTERYVVEAIERLKGEWTIIMIAHRLTTVMKCDVLYEMEKGKIVRHGTYDRLMETSERFREMALDI